MAAVLLIAGLAAASTVDRPAGDGLTADGRVGAASLGSSALLDEATGDRTSHTTVVVAPPPTSGPPASTTTVSRPAPSTTRTTTPKGSTGATVLPGVPAPNSPPPTGIPNIAPASTWTAERDGVSARLRIDPPAPIAGQRVRFFVDVSSAEACCTVLLDFGDGSTGYSANNGVPCGSLSPGSKSLQTDHVFEAAGAYKATLTVMTGFACQPPLAPGASPTLPSFHSVSLNACLALGPGSAGQGGCSPFPTFGPDSIISPVLDPFCQVRSDCTQASPPR